MAHRLAMALRAALLGLVATLALSVDVARAEDQVFTIPDYATARENLSPRHAQAWRIYEYHRINQAKQKAAIDEYNFLKQDLDAMTTSGPLGWMALSREQLGQKMQAANARRAEAEDELSKAEKVWSNNNFDVAIGQLGEDSSRMITVRYEDPDRPGKLITRQMNRIEYRLYNGKRLGIFKAPGGLTNTYVGDPDSEPIPVPLPGDSGDDASACPPGKGKVWCDGKPVCVEPNKPYICPTGSEACTGPDCAAPGSAAGGITSILRGN